MTELSCTHLPEGICDGCAEALRTEDSPTPLIVAAVELRAWARASQLTATREGFHRTAAAVGSYIDLLELAMRSGAPNEGATEELEAFAFGVIQCERERGEWVCWHEENAESPSGLERIC